MIKKFVFSSILLLIPWSVMAEDINSYVTVIETQGNDTYLITETIEYDFGEDYRHGIFRDIKLSHPVKASNFFKERYIELELLSITMNGTSVPFEENESFSTWSAKIGDGEIDITGVQTYEIRYILRGSLFAYEDGQLDFYWNVTGNGWKVPIEEALAIFVDTENQRLEAASCYQGISGSSQKCPVTTSSTSTVFGPVSLGAGEGLTISQSIDKERVDPLVIERWTYGWLFLLAFLILIPGAVFIIYRYHTVNRSGRTIVAEYEPYRSFKPTYIGTLLDGRLDPQDITAGIVYLAEQGFLKIRKTDQKVFFFFDVDDYEIELTEEMRKINDPVLSDIISILFDQNAVVGSKVRLSELKKDFSKMKENSALLIKLQADIKAQMRSDGFFEVRRGYKMPLAISFALLLAALIAFFAGQYALFATVLLAGVCFTIVLIALYERRTREGHLALDHLRGFKLFLSVTDKERFSFHNAPQRSPEQFMEYLPYAIAFKVEKEWAKVFEDISIPNPSWYDDKTGASFSAVHMTSSIGAFSTAFAASSGTTSSSGGGSSGGGAGGGGGGSW